MHGVSVAVPNLDLRPDHWDIVRDALRRHVPDREVRAFGSRAKWTASDYSDLDLAIMGAEPLSLRTLADLDEALEESDLPFRVDIVDWASTDASFRAVICREAVTVQAPTASFGVADGTYRGASATMPFNQAFIVNPSVRVERGSRTPFVNMAAIEPSLRIVRAIGARKFRGSGSRFRHGDTLMARIIPCLENGKVARYLADGDVDVAHGSTEFIVVRGRPGVTDSEYAFYVTRSDFVRNYAIGQMTGTSVRQRVSPASLAQLDVVVPPIPDQRAIAHILGTLDDKIELNQRMNGTLKAIVQALFKSWFVDYDPVRAKMERKYTDFPKAIANLFPDRMVDSEIGEIPAGWDVFRLDELSHRHTPSTSPLKSPANRRLLSALFADQQFRALLYSKVNGTSKGHQRVLPKTLKAQEVLAGSRTSFAEFGEATGSMLDRIQKNRSESATLGALRDTLLPKLISGEIRVHDAARAVESLA